VPQLNLIAAHAEALRPFVYSSPHGSLDSEWVHELEIGEPDPLEPLERYGAPLLRIAEEALVP
jgi:hypothetical protein